MGTGEDINVYKRLKSKTRVINCVDKYTINESAAILKKCDFIVCNDTGLSHIASAVGCKVYAIFGGTSIVKNYPWNGGSIISRNLECSPCQYDPAKMTNCQSVDCMKIKPSEVYNKIVEIKDTKQYTLGIVISIYERYELLISSLYSLINCNGFENIKISIIDDGSQDKRIESLFDNLKLKNIKVVYNKNYFNKGKEGYGSTLKKAFDELYNCKYVLFLQPDIIINKYLFDVIKKSYKYFNNDVKCIDFFMDNRSDRECIYFRQKYKHLGSYRKYFHYIKGIDGTLLLFERDFIEKNFDFKHTATDLGSMVWQHLNQYFWDNNKKVIQYNESLAEHIGNNDSALNPSKRKEYPIYAYKLNLFSKPKII
jgi:hypothetical protein